MGEVAFGLYAAPSWLEHHGPLDPAGGGEGQSVILTEPDLLGTPEMAWFRTLLPRADVAFATNSRLLQRSAARDGMGIACLACYLGDRFLGLVRLAPPAAAAPPPVRDLFLGVHADIRHMPRIRAFTDALRDGIEMAAHVLRPDAG